MNFYFLLSVGILAVYTLYSLIYIKGRDQNQTLSHNDITTVLSSLNYPKQDGVCFGFSLNWAASISQHQESLFYEQLKTLKNHKNSLQDIEQRIQEKEYLNIPLTENDQKLQKVLLRCKQIFIAQAPLENRDVYKKKVWQPDINTILDAISTKTDTIKQLYSKTLTLSAKKYGLQFFENLLAIQLPEDIALIICNADHAMGLRRFKKKWEFIDINSLYNQDQQKPFFSLNSSQLVDKLYESSSLSSHARRLTLNIDYIGLKNHSFSDQLPLIDHQFGKIRISPNISSKEKLSFFTMAAWQGDLQSISQCIQSGWSVFKKHQWNNNSPIFYAICMGRTKVVKEMLPCIKHRINEARARDKRTLLHIACFYGVSDIVELFLEIKDINIDALDHEGRTPLMLACQSTLTYDEEKIFQLLIKNNASLTIKDKLGLTALDYARKNDNLVALCLFKEISVIKPINRPLESGFFTSPKVSATNNTISLKPQ